MILGQPQNGIKLHGGTPAGDKDNARPGVSPRATSAGQGCSAPVGNPASSQTNSRVAS